MRYIDPIHTGGAKIPETRDEAIALAVEIRMQCIQRKLAGAGFYSLEDREMTGFDALKAALFAVFEVKKHKESHLSEDAAGAQAVDIVLELAERQIKRQWKDGWNDEVHD